MLFAAYCQYLIKMMMMMMMMGTHGNAIPRPAISAI